jgi:hypothetical protein
MDGGGKGEHGLVMFSKKKVGTRSMFANDYHGEQTGYHNPVSAPL